MLASAMRSSAMPLESHGWYPGGIELFTSANGVVAVLLVFQELGLSL